MNGYFGVNNSLKGSVLLLLPVLMGMMLITKMVVLSIENTRLDIQFKNRIQTQVLHHSIHRYYKNQIDQLVLYDSCYQDEQWDMVIHTLHSFRVWIYRCQEDDVDQIAFGFTHNNG